MKLLLSGGSHRAGLGAIGAIGYFCWAEATDLTPDDRGRRDRWSDVDEIVSVSGGSMLNARLAAASIGSGDVDDTCASMRAMRDALLHDRMLPHRSVRRVAITLGVAITVAVAAWALLAALGLVGPDALGDSPWSVVVGLAIVPVTALVVRRLLAAYLRDIADVVTAGERPIGESESPRRHVLCASGLSSGVPYYFVAGRGPAHPFEPPWGAVLTEGYSIADAAMASGSLPGFGQVRAPATHRREILVDGGVSGSFGEQTSTTLQRRPEDTWRSSGDWFAIDAVRHLEADGTLGDRLRSLSLLAVAFRWLKISIEATYVNDLLDLGPGQYARVWTSNPVLPGRPALAGDAALLRRRLATIQTAVGDLSLTGLDRAGGAAAVVAGFVSTLEVRRGLRADEIEAGLAWLDDQLAANGQLVAAWASAEPLAVDETSASKADASSGGSDSTNR